MLLLNRIASTIMVASTTLPVFAQSTAPAEPANTAHMGTLEEVEVIAQRRSEPLQNVPISITAVTAARIESAGITSSQDLPMVTPGLTMTNARNTVTPYIRGIGTQSGTAGTEGAVAVYVDGIYLPNAVSSVFSLNNIDRIEVLKGPQGTLFGRNATGGLIHVITRDPSRTPELKGSVGYANYDTSSTSIYATGPLSKKVTADVALYGSYQGDGWGKNFTLGNDVNIRREGMVRSKMKVDFTDETSLLLGADYGRWRSDNGNVKQPLAGTATSGGFRAVGSIYDRSTIQPFPADSSWQGGVSAVFNHRWNDSISFTSTSGYRELSVYSTTDTDASPAVLSDVYFLEVGRSFQQELMLNGDIGPLSWTGGLFYFKAMSSWDPLTFRAAPPSPVNASRYTRLHTDSYAAFAQGTYALTDATNLTLGARYTLDEKDAEGRFIANAGNTAPIGTVIVNTANLPRSQTERDWSAVTWRVALDHKLTDSVLVYGSANRGFKSGAFNATDPTQPALSPETLNSYEAGFKSDLLGRMLRVNSAAYYYDYKNIQLQSVTGAGTVNFNAPVGKVRGIDVEVVCAPYLENGELTFSGSVAALKGEYENFPNAPYTIPRNTTVAPFGGNIATAGSGNGKEMVRSPKFSSSLSIDYTIPITATLEAGFNLAWQHSGKFYWEVDNRVAQSSYDLVNAQISVGAVDEKWRVRLWTRNALDEEYFIVVNTTALSDAGVAGAPLTYGLSMDYKFGG